MSSVLRKGLVSLFDKCLQNDFFLEVHEAWPTCFDCVLVTNPDKKTMAWLGVMEDEHDHETLVAFMINLPKWDWAETEGFDIDGILQHEALCDEIFQLTDPRYLHLKLV